jgi:hypothetical protein
MRPLRLKSAGSSGSNGASLAAAGDYHPVSISLLADYPVRGWVVEGPSLAGMAQVRGLVVGVVFRGGVEAWGGSGGAGVEGGGVQGGGEQG